MAKEIRKTPPQTGNEKGLSGLSIEASPANNSLSADLAIGILTLASTVILLFLFCYLIYIFYTPDLEAIKNAVAPLSIFPPSWFHPEPVERSQFQLCLVLMPVFVFVFYSLLKRKRYLFINNPTVSRAIIYVTLCVFSIYLVLMLNEPLKVMKLKGLINMNFFQELFIGKYFFLAVILYTVGAYFFLMLCKKQPVGQVKWVITGLSWCVVVWVLYEIMIYNGFQIADVGMSNLHETNAVFYAVSQVVAGKSLLVQFNAQYGLYAWVLKPVFGIIGFSIQKFAAVMAVLNVLSFLFIWLGIKKLIRNNILSMLVFLCLVFWQYWHIRIGFEESANPFYYYQYEPIRLFFPALIFFLFTTFTFSGPKWHRVYVPLLALGASLGILWNLDTGLVTYGALGAGLIFSAIHNSGNTREAIAKAVIYSCWMGGALAVIFAWFFISTKINSGYWPEIAKFSAFQKMYYISGFGMLPMTALHFWNLVAVVYVVGSIYALFKLQNTNQQDLPVLAFLVILGMGLLVYFQGRSYDLTIMTVMYPAIIIAGVLCSKYIPEFIGFKIKYHEIVLLFFIPFLFLADGALSMIYYTPEIHTLAANDDSVIDKAADREYNDQIAFIRKNVPEHDSVIIISKDYDGFLYASGRYINPLPIPGSTEILLRSDFMAILNGVKSGRYPVIFDMLHPWQLSDSIVTVLAQYTEIKEEMPDRSMLYLQPVKQKVARLHKGKRVMYHENLDQFRSLYLEKYQLQLSDTFTLELLIRLDPAKLKRNEVVFSTAAKTTPNCGFYMRQSGNQLNQYAFTYGNGTNWCDSVVFSLRSDTENHLVLKVQKNIITAYNNGMQCSQANTHSVMKDSEGTFVFNKFFSGRVEEVLLLDE